jgi:hypothetical protein
VSFGWDWMLLEVCVVGEAGIEPTTPSLEGSCSIQLSYSPTLDEGPANMVFVFHCKSGTVKYRLTRVWQESVVVTSM